MDSVRCAAALLRQDQAFVTRRQPQHRVPHSTYWRLSSETEEDWISRMAVSIAERGVYNGLGWLPDGRSYEFTTPLHKDWAVIECRQAPRFREIVERDGLFERLDALTKAKADKVCPIPPDEAAQETRVVSF